MPEAAQDHHTEAVITFEGPGRGAAAHTNNRTACISVIIPVWHDSDNLFPLLTRLRSFPEIRQVIVSAAEPIPGTRERVEALGGAFLQSPKANRGAQLNSGARIATGDWLLFQHVDTEIRRQHIDAVAALDDGEIVGGAFYRGFDERHPRLRRFEKLERWHSRAFGTLYGDQSIFVRREHFWCIGGFAAIPLMEDVDLSRRLRRSGRIKLLDPAIRSCPQEQIAQGAWRTTCRNFLFLALFRCGVPASHLHRWYYADQLRKSHDPQLGECGGSSLQRQNLL